MIVARSEITDPRIVVELERIACHHVARVTTLYARARLVAGVLVDALLELRRLSPAVAADLEREIAKALGAARGTDGGA